MNTAPDTTVVMAGGLANFNGFTLAPGPKFCLPIANRPLWHYLSLILASVGVRRLIVCVNPVLKGYEACFAESFRDVPLELDLRVQETAFGTGGSLREIRDRLPPGTFWVVSGDLLLQGDLSQMLSLHRERRALATVAAVRLQEPPWRMERVEFDADKRVKAIHRLHPAQEKRSMLRPIGLYLFEAQVLEMIPANGYFDLKEQLFARLYEEDETTAVWEMEGYCRTITSIDEYFGANRDVVTGRVQFPEMGNLWGLPAPTEADRPQISPSVALYDPIVMGAAAQIDDEAIIIGPSVIGDHCQVGANTILNEAVILRRARIGRAGYLSHCIISEGAVVEDGAILQDVVVPEGTPDGEKLAILPPLEHAHYEVGSTLSQLGWRSRSREIYLVMKRWFDVAFALVALALSLPLAILLALAIKLDSPGPAIFRQERCGRNGRRFMMYKFRTMVSNAEDLKRELQPLNEVDGPTFRITDDPRLTRVGRIIRNTDMDEIPQLINVLEGDMSMVGPRPLSIEEMRYNPRWRDVRLTVRPGVTGLWQVEAHTKLRFNEWIRHDIDYVRNCSFGLDLKIISRTFLKVIRDTLRTFKIIQFTSEN